MTIKPKDYLTYENQRNRTHAQIYETLIKKALGAKWVVLTGHHFLYERDGDVNTEGEIPSADTVLFDHDIMTAVFGNEAINIMSDLARVPCSERESVLALHLEAKGLISLAA
jgi:hypothetical protein